MMSFRLHLKKVKKQHHTKIAFSLEKLKDPLTIFDTDSDMDTKFNPEKLKDPEVAEAFQAIIGGRLAPITIFDTDSDMNTQSPPSTLQ